MILLGLTSLLALGGLVGQALGDECRECKSSEAATEYLDEVEDDHVLVREIFTVKQTKLDDGADELDFTLWQREDNIYLKGWRACIDKFTNASSMRANQPGEYHDELKNHSCCPETDDPDNGEHATDVSSNKTDGVIAKDEEVDVYCCFWLTHKNTKRLANVEWDKAKDPVKACPDFGWLVEDPVGSGGVYWHMVEIRNDDPSLDLRIETVRLLADMAFISDLKTVPFAGYESGFPRTLVPGETVQLSIPTPGIFLNCHIYGEVVLQDATGTDYRVVEIFDHPVTLTKPVPTTSQWGLLVLLCLLIASGLFVVLHRRRASLRHTKAG